MRILQIVPSVSIAAGGVPRVVIDLSVALVGAGCVVDLVVLQKSDGPEFHIPAKAGLTVYSPGELGRFGMLTQDAKNQLIRLISQADVIHLHGLWQPANYQAWKLCQSAHKPVVTTVHGMLAPWSMQQSRLKKKIYYALFESKLINHSALLHFTADLERKTASPWYAPNIRTAVIPPVFVIDDYNRLPEHHSYAQQIPELSKVKQYILFVGRLHHKKGIEPLIRGFSMIASGYQDISLIIAGPGPADYRQSLESLANECGVASRVIFLNSVTGAAKTAVYRGATLFATISHQENFGIVFAEALACETPVLMTEGVDIYPDILQNKIGFVTKPDPESVAGSLRKILTDHRPELDEMGRCGRQWVLDTLSPEAVARRWVEAYQSVLNH